jgi:PilZ domain-containing protein
VNERRQSFRIVAVPDFDQVVLKVRERQITTRLVDTSASGLGVMCDPSVCVQVGERLKVQTDTDWYSVKVARVETSPEGHLLGLERTADQDDARVSRKTESRVVAIAFAVFVLAMPALTMAWVFRPLRGRVAANSLQPVQFDTALPAPADHPSGSGPVATP